MSGFAGDLVTGASLIPGALASPLFVVGNQLIENILIQRPRSIGLLVPNVVVEEQHRDELVVTEHPIERGAAISDHVFKRPAEVVMRCGWSNSSSILGFGETYSDVIYEQIRALQASGEPCDVVTGKRLYKNMVVIQIAVQTDSRWEYALNAVIIMREVIIVDTQATTLPPADSQAMPQQTAPVIENGVQQPVSVPTAAGRSSMSVLSNIGSLF